MHKRIVKAIDDALTKHDKEDLLDIFVASKETGGFWSMIIVMNPEYIHMIPHIESVGMSIGRFYGEGLNVNKKHNYIIFS